MHGQSLSNTLQATHHNCHAFRKPPSVAVAAKLRRDQHVQQSSSYGQAGTRQLQAWMRQVEAPCELNVTHFVAGVLARHLSQDCLVKGSTLFSKSCNW